jgi:nucleoside-diphosphate-sugar epimerase
VAVLVTGGAGFVGSHLVDALAARGEQVVVADNLITGRLANLESHLQDEHVTFVYLDVASPVDAIRAALAGATTEAITQIFHLASPASPEAYGAHPWETLAVNALGTMSLIELACDSGAQLLFTSTSEVYGDPLVHPQPESYFGNVNPVGPRACYDEGKRFAEAAMSVAIDERGLNGRIVRIFNCYGPRMDLADGRLIPALFSAAQAGLPMPLHGTGEQTRSMTYVADLVAGLLAVADAPMRGVHPVNLGNEHESTVREVAQLVAEIAGVPYTVEQLPARPEDPQRRCPDISFARSLGWEPRTSLRDGLQRTFTWLRTERVQYA